MSKTKPLIWLDVDGVVNRLSRVTVDPHSFQFEPEFIYEDEYVRVALNLSRQMGEALAALDCEIIWLSSWVRRADWANPIISPRLGFGELPYPDPHNPIWAEQPVSLYKQLVAREWLREPGPPVFWIDDDVDLLYDSKLDPHARVTQVCTDSTVGLTRAQVADIRDKI